MNFEIFDGNGASLGCATLPVPTTESESDALAAIESGFTNTVSVPFGSQNFQWIEHNWQWLEQFTTIIICSDNDEAGVKMRKEIVPRLGSWRTRYVEIPHTYHDPDTEKDIPIKDLNEVLYYMGKSAVANLINNAEDPGVPSIVNISEIQDVDLDEMDGINTGIRELDAEIMRLFYGTLTVVSGLPGAGKTSFLSQLVCHSFSFRVAIDLSILLYYVRRFFGITLVAHPHSGWLSVSHFALNCLKALNIRKRRLQWCNRRFNVFS